MRRSLFLPALSLVFPAKAQPVLQPALMEHASRLLVALIKTAREGAISAGVKPPPPQIHSALLGFFPDALLRKVRFSSGQADAITIPGLAMTYGHLDAITLSDVILFHHDRDARTNHALWAHELTHVMQYQRWGIDGFAARYLQDFNTIEKEARDNAARYVTWREHART